MAGTTAQHLLGFVMTGGIGAAMVFFLGLRRSERVKCLGYVMRYLGR